MLRPANCRQTNAELYSLTTATHESIRFRHSDRLFAGSVIATLSLVHHD